MIQHIKTLGTRCATMSIVLILSGCSNNYQLAANSLILADWAQTRHIADSDAFYEMNKTLGRDPSTGDVNRYFVASIVVVNVLGEYAMPDVLKDYFYLYMATRRGLTVANNYRIGVRLKF